MTHTQEQIAALVKRLRHNRPSHVDADIWMQDAADMLEQLAARTYEDGVRDAAKVAQGQYVSQSNYSPESVFYGLDMTPDRSDWGRGIQRGRDQAAAAIRALLTEKPHD